MNPYYYDDNPYNYDEDDKTAAQIAEEKMLKEAEQEAYRRFERELAEHDAQFNKKNKEA